MGDVRRIGVASVQGAVSEHRVAVEAALAALGQSGHVVTLRTASDAETVDAVILPGGESTTIAKLLDRSGATDVLIRRAIDEDMPILGTCAGAILLAREGDEQVRKTSTRLLGLMDMAIDRNAFGRQRESFETDLTVVGIEGPLHAVFIRAPAITKTWGDCRVLATFADRVVAARHGNRWATAFHPELTTDTRLHQAFLASA